MTKKISCYIFALISKINYFIGFLIEIPAAFFNQISNIFYGFRIISDQRAKPPTIYSSFLFRFQFCIHWILHKDLCLLFSSFSSFMVFIRPQSNKNRLFFGLKTNMFFLTLLVLFHVFQQKRKERSVFFHASTLIWPAYNFYSCCPFQNMYMVSCKSARKHFFRSPGWNDILSNFSSDEKMAP